MKRIIRRIPRDWRWLGIFSAFFGAVVSGWTANAHALTIVPLFDSTITSLPNAAQYEAGVNDAIGEIDSRFADPITLHINFAATSDPNALGGSSANLLESLTYGQLTAALAADATTANDATAVAHFGVDPTNGGTFLISIANAAALGFGNFESIAGGVSGTVTFGSAQSYSFDPNNRVVPGKFDFIGVAEHEITEVMGRITELGVDFGAGNDYLPYDIFRYTGNGVASVNPDDTNVYFSIDGGATILKFYNGPGGGDLGDWASGFGPDAFNAFAAAGDSLPMTEVDLQAMDVIGYDFVPAPSVPEPPSLLLVLMGGVGLAVLRFAGKTRPLA